MIAPAVRVPILPEVEKRLVDEAVPEKKVVEVALVVVAFIAVKFWRVVEELTKRLLLILTRPSLPILILSTAEVELIGVVENET